MNVEEVIEQGKAVGLIIKTCHDPKYLAVDCGEATDPNERIRITSDGSVLIVDEGRYLQVGKVEEVFAAIRERVKP